MGALDRIPFSGITQDEHGRKTYRVPGRPARSVLIRGPAHERQVRLVAFAFNVALAACVAAAFVGDAGWFLPVAAAFLLIVVAYAFAMRRALGIPPD